MTWRSGILMGIAVIFFGLLLHSKTEVKDYDYDKMYAIAEQVETAFMAIRDEKERRGIAYDHPSGMLGPEFTGITTTLGAYESKTTAANPNFSSVIYSYIRQMGLAEGSAIGLNLSSSFPSLNVQAIITLEAMGYEPIIISSVGASTHGATDPEMTYQDMEQYLFETGHIHHKSTMVSAGGDDDLGINMDPDLLEEIFNRLSSYGYEVLIEEDYHQNIRMRTKAYGDIDAFINIGGNYVSFTENDIGYDHMHGLIEDGYNYGNEGLIGYYLSANKPVLHLLNIKDIAIENNLPIDPETPVVGEDGSFYKEHYQIGYLIPMMVALILLTMENVYEQRRRKNKQIKTIIEQELMG